MKNGGTVLIFDRNGDLVNATCCFHFPADATPEDFFVLSLVAKLWLCKRYKYFRTMGKGLSTGLSCVVPCRATHINRLTVQGPASRTLHLFRLVKEQWQEKYLCI